MKRLLSNLVLLAGTAIIVAPVALSQPSNPYVLTAAKIATALGFTPASATLTSGHILVGNVSNVATDVAMSGSCTMANTGAITCSGGGLTVGTTTITSGTTGRVLYDNAGVVGEMTNTGTGTVNVLQASPTLTTPVLGVASGTSLRLGGASIGSDALAITGTSTFSDAITISANGLTINGGGATINGNITTTGNSDFNVASARYHRWSNRSRMAAPTNGTIVITNDAETLIASIRPAYTVSTLPASAVTGAMAYVTDALNAASCVLATAPTAGGTTFCPVSYNGSAWVGG